MGNVLVNKRVKDAIGIEDSDDGDKKKTSGGEHRIWPDHMYTGPLKLGDPYYRGLSKMEADPMLPQRMRDVARTDLCVEYVNKFSACTQKAGFGMIIACRPERDEMVACIERWFDKPEFRERVTEEYLNERSHFRETGVKTKRYARGKYIERDLDEHGPSLDKNGLYRPRKPRDWDKYYQDGPPKWTDYDYQQQ